MADLEKQALNTTESYSSDDRLDESNDNARIKRPHENANRSPSTTFAPMVKPKYTGADGREEGAKPIRTFSRRTAMTEDCGAHVFGGDLTRTRTELDVQRFESRMRTREGEEEVGKEEPILVNWEGDNDRENPQNFSLWYKCYVTVFGAILVLNSTFTSSAPNGVGPQQMTYFGFSREVNTLLISLWVAGYCLGPLIWGPLSERLGRKPVFLISIITYTGWNVGCALSKNTASILVFRFLGGTFGAAPMTNSGGLIADVWDAKRRGVAMCLFALAPFAGPALGPIVSGAIAVTGTSWRWVYWTCALFSGTCFIVTLFTIRETYAPVILQRKAKRISKETGRHYIAPLDLTPLKANTLLHDTIFLPFIMLFKEPILLAIGIYLSFVYGILYLQFGAYPIIFEGVHGFNALIGGLMFLGLFVGCCIGVLFSIFIINPSYTKKVDQYTLEKKGRVPPEERLWVVLVAAPCLVISFFWMGWTAYRSISFWSPLLAGGLLGFGIFNVFVGLFNYIVDAYLARAASALAGNTVMRSAFGAGFPLFTIQMFNTLTIKWACTLLGGLALLMLPIPFVLMKYGPNIRRMSRFSAP